MPSAKVVNGNKACAYGVKLARPSLIAAYPINPQTSMLEYIAEFIAQGELDAEFVTVESEHSAMSVIQGGHLAGERVFSATSSQGLAYMYEAYLRSALSRYPMVMAIATREWCSPHQVFSSQQDAITVRDAGWIQLWVETNQELLDTVVQAYRIAEDYDVWLPVNVCYDGYYLSHFTEAVQVPEQADVDRYLPPFNPPHKLDPMNPATFDPAADGRTVMEFRRAHCEAMHRAKSVIEQADREFAAIFGRGYGGLLESYRTEDADYILVTLGAMSGTAKEAADAARENGVKVGVIRLRVLRPFPREALREALVRARVVGIVDRNVVWGWSCGAVFYESLAALAGTPGMPLLLDFIGGLGGADIKESHFAGMIDTMVRAGRGERVPTVNWFDLGPGETEVWPAAEPVPARIGG